jgi:hypothetical protein
LEDREKLIKEMIIEEEYVEKMQLKGIKTKVWEILTMEKKFHPGEIEIDPEFNLTLSDCEITVSVDFIINFPSESFMVIKCSPTAIESWERYVISFAKVIKDYQIPYAVVTDGDNARIIDILTGSIVSESLSSLFNREEALDKMRDFKKIPCPAKRLEKEKRIIYAFEGIKCPAPKDPGD